MSEAAQALMPARVQATWRFSTRPHPTSNAPTSRNAGRRRVRHLVGSARLQLFRDDPLREDHRRHPARGIERCRPHRDRADQCGDHDHAGRDQQLPLVDHGEAGEAGGDARQREQGTGQTPAGADPFQDQPARPAAPGMRRWRGRSSRPDPGRPTGSSRRRSPHPAAGRRRRNRARRVRRCWPPAVRAMAAARRLAAVLFHGPPQSVRLSGGQHPLRNQRLQLTRERGGAVASSS